MRDTGYTNIYVNKEVQCVIQMGSLCCGDLMKLNGMISREVSGE